MLTTVALLTRIGAGAALGGVIGYERDVHGRQVGLRTHLLVSMAAATFMVVSSQFAFYQHFDGQPGVEVDASRIAASVVSGIGFLAGGSILRTGPTIQGMTTAAGLWLVTAIGLCAGAGMFVVSAVVTTAGVLALTLLRRFEDKDDKIARRRVTMTLAEKATASGVLEALRALGVVMTDIEYERDEQRRVIIAVDMRLPAGVAVDAMIALLEEHADVRRLRVQQP